MSTTIASTPTNVAATAYTNQRKIDRCQNGNLVGIYADTTTNGVIKYSSDDGKTWASAAPDIAGLSNASIFVDLDDYIHVVWRQNGTGGSRVDKNLYYMRGTPNAARTAWTWSAAQNAFNEISQTNTTLPDYPDVVAFRDPSSGWQVGIIASYNRSNPNNYALYVRISVSSGGVFTYSRDNLPNFTGEGTAGYVGGDYLTNAPTFPSIDFNHTGDGKTVAGGTPHLYAAWSAGGVGSGKGVRFRKATYSAGTWTWGTEREFDNTVYVDDGLTRGLGCLFDGTRVIIGGTARTAGANFGGYLAERDAADTTTSIRRSTADSVSSESITYDRDGNVYFVGQDAGQVKLRQFSRSSLTLGTATVTDSMTAGSNLFSASFRRGFATRVEWTYTFGTGSPYTVKYDFLSLNNKNQYGGYGSIAYGAGQYGASHRSLTAADVGVVIGSTAPTTPSTMSLDAPAGVVAGGANVNGPVATSVPGVWDAPAGIVTAGVNITGFPSPINFGFDPDPVTYDPPPTVDGVDGGTLGTGPGGTDGPPPTNVDGTDSETAAAYDQTDVGAVTDGELEIAGSSVGGSVFGGTGPDPDTYIPIEWDPYPAGLPTLSSYTSTKRRRPLRRNSIFMGPLTLDLYGRPVDWAVTNRIQEDWGALKVYCGTTDVTTFRGVHTRIESYEFMEPFGYGPAVIAFPQISTFDALGVGSLSWFKQGMNVTLKRVHPDGVTETTVWEGLAASWEPQVDEESYEFELHCIGALHQPTLEPYPPRFKKDAIDIGIAIADALNTQPGRRFAAIPNVTTGVLTRNRGAWNSRFDYVLELLSTAYTADGNNQWTIGCNPGRFPVLKLKNLTTQNWTVTNGAAGVLLKEKSDVTTSKNAIFGEGIDDEGGRWRNSRYPKVTGAPTFRPLTWVTQNEPYTYNAEGIRTGRNPHYDPKRLRVAIYENMGMGVDFDEGVKSSRAELKRDVNPGWFGTIELTSDPEEGSKWDMRAGQNVGVRHHHGSAVRLMHIAHIEALPEENKVILTVDTNARDYETLATLTERNKEALQDPARRLNPPRRKSKFVPDERSAFDAESGAGYLNPVAVSAGTWKVRRIPAGDYGTIPRTEFTASLVTKFAIGIFSKSVSTATLGTLVGNPLAQDDPWGGDDSDALSTAGLLVAWGSKNEAMGYYPSTQSDGGTLTGRFADYGSWDFISDDVPWLYVAIWTNVSATFSGRLYPAAED